MIDIVNEHLLTMTEAAKVPPQRPTVSTVWRWFRRGRHGVKLETILCGGRRFTSREAIDRFFAAVTAASDGEAVVTVSSTLNARVRRAEREAEELGIK